MASLLIIGWSSDGHATCNEVTDYKLEKGNKERNIEQILRYGKCVKEEQKQRVGKWFLLCIEFRRYSKSRQWSVLLGNY